MTIVYESLKNTDWGLNEKINMGTSHHESPNESEIHFLTSNEFELYIKENSLDVLKEKLKNPFLFSSETYRMLYLYVNERLQNHPKAYETLVLNHKILSHDDFYRGLPEYLTYSDPINILVYILIHTSRRNEHEIIKWLWDKAPFVWECDKASLIDHLTASISGCKQYARLVNIDRVLTHDFWMKNAGKLHYFTTAYEKIKFIYNTSSFNQKALSRWLSQNQWERPASPFSDSRLGELSCVQGVFRFSSLPLFPVDSPYPEVFFPFSLPKLNSTNLQAFEFSYPDRPCSPDSFGGDDESPSHGEDEQSPKPRWLGI